MLYYIIKLVLSAILILLISEIGKHNTFMGSLLASLPLISIISIIWIYLDTKDVDRIMNLSYNIFWFVLPSLTLFISLPIFLKYGLNFYISLISSIICTIIFYFIMIFFLQNILKININ